MHPSHMSPKAAPSLEPSSTVDAVASFTVFVHSVDVMLKLVPSAKGLLALTALVLISSLVQCGLHEFIP